jgi:ABC-type multidrug transport system fused ATPase/permease subunit
MMEKVLNAPINLYFDTTPIGRIMNRFSKDLQLIEVMFNYQIGGLYVALYITLSIVVLSICVVPWIALVYPFMTLIILFLFKITISANKEVNRIESLTKSPLLSYLTESISGNSTIRAF